MIPTLRRVGKRQHRVPEHADVDNFFNHQPAPPLKCAAIATIARDTGIPEATLLHWNRRRAADPTRFPLAMNTLRHGPSTRRPNPPSPTSQEHGAELLFMPAGVTGRFQQGDRRVFGELKARTRAEFADGD